MDLTSGENNSISNHFKWSTFQALEEALKCSSSFEEKCVLWRQQSLIIKTFDENLACDFMRRHWLHQDFPEDNSDFQKYFGVSLFCDHTKHVEFPDIQEISLEREPDSDEELFSADVMALLDHRGNCEIEKPSSKERNTMENFLQEQTKSENQNNDFCSARELLVVQTMMKGMQNDNSENQRRNANNIQQKPDVGFNFSATKKSLGSLGRITNSTRKNFVSPVRSKSSNTEISKNEEVVDGEIASLLLHPALKNVDPKMVELINNEIIHTFKPVDWNEIAGLDYAKSIIKEAVVYPLLRPDIFTGLRRPPKGILLFGPPGTGKTLIGKCIASQSSSTFFSISSASLTSKWMGEGEKMVRALFAVAVARQPSVIFIDEIDSLLSQRSENENEGTRRLKTEFLVRLDGAATLDDDRVIIVGATNRPQELDEAVRRRFVKRLYVPLPEIDARAEILTNLLKTVDNDLNPNDIKEISELAAGYSGADMDSLCREASMEPLRSLPAEAIITFQKEQLRPVNIVDFRIALKKIRPSVSQSDLNQYVEWNKTFGSSY